jgi:hypothetical protein
MSQDVFSGQFVQSWLSSKLDSHIKEIKDMTALDFKGKTIDVLCEQLYEAYKLIAPIISEDNKVVEVKDTKINVTGNGAHDGFGRSGPTFTTGVEAIYTVPIVGDQQLLILSPSTCYPIDAKIDKQNLVVKIKVVDSERDNIKPLYNRRIQDIKQGIQSMETDFATFNINLKRQLKEALNAQWSRLEALKQLKDSL